MKCLTAQEKRRVEEWKKSAKEKTSLKQKSGWGYNLHGECGYSEPCVSVGDIRIVKLPDKKGNNQYRYVTVIGTWGKNHCVISPFSIFTVPATRGEVKTSKREDRFSVVSAWNSVIVPNRFFIDVKKVDSLCKKDVTLCWNIFRYVSTGIVEDEKVFEKTGARIISKIDPRKMYQKIEKATFMFLRERKASEN